MSFTKEERVIPSEHLSFDQIRGAASAGPSSLPPAASGHLGDCRQCAELVKFVNGLGQVKPDRATDLGDCPSQAVLLEIAEGLTVPDTSLYRHITQCHRCVTTLREFSEDLQDDNLPETKDLRTASPGWQHALAGKIASSAGATFPEPRRLRLPWIQFGQRARWVYAAAVAMVFCLGVVAWLVWRSRPSYADRLLADAYTAQRTMEVRIQGARYGPLRVTRGPEMSRLNRPPELLEAEAVIARGLAAHPDDAAWLQARGRAELIDDDYEAAIKSLERAHRLSPNDSGIGVDLASAYFLRAERLDRQIDYGQAVDLLSQVLAKHPSDHVALFNRAISLERIFLYHQAVADWQKLLEVDAKSEWADEARARLAALQDKIRQQKERSENPLKSPAEFVAAIESRQEDLIAEIDSRFERYLQMAVEEWLPQAFEKKPGNLHASQIARRAVVGLADLMRLRHRDSWLSDLVSQAASKAKAPAAIERLAEAVRLNQTSDRDGARDAAMTAAELFREARIPSGQLRAEFEGIYAQQQVHQNQGCSQGAEKLADLPGLRSYVWLRIQNLIESAVCASLSDERALALMTEARQLAEKHRYSILQIRAVTLLAGSSSTIGDQTAAWNHSREGLRLYWTGDYPSFRGYNVYANLDYLAEDDQLWFLQAAVLMEALEVLHDTPDTVLRALEQGRLSQALLMTGDISRAEAGFREMRSLFADSIQGTRRTNLEAESEIGLANVELRRGGEKSAVARLEKIRATVSQIQDKDLWLSFFQSLGMAELKAGDKTNAERTLSVALNLAEEGLSLISNERKRLEWSRKNEQTYRAMVQLKFPDDPEKALAYWERYKGASLRSGRQEPTRYAPLASAVEPSLPAAGTVMSNDSAVISYALFDQGTAIWIYDRSGVRGRWLGSPRVEIESLARVFLEHCADPRSDTQLLRREALQLYEKTFAPIEPLLQNYKRLVIEPDGSLEPLPFETLLDGRGIYLGDRYSITFSSGLDYLARAKTWGGLSKRSRALVIGDPTAPGWRRLAAAEVEAQSVASLFEGSRFLMRQAANYPAIVQELPRSEVFHFSGHGTASASGAGLVLGSSDLLDVLKLDGLSFRQTKLVVLSACASAQGTTGIFSDPHSVARLLIGDGVPEVVASRWTADSDATAVLMKEFYSQLLRGEGVADSLHAASAELRRHAETAHPFYWASFAVFGKG